ncbi:hypothetical protein PRUPE_4G026500 [Prunus persica]|uniref:Uncharacterized protein n=1 Tax=Prunus persica TaxID=3760 RepID=M5WJM9_PRUPE|nr:hypothetical protein PRUPE_4G026500 [Prunus persica]
MLGKEPSTTTQCTPGLQSTCLKKKFQNTSCVLISPIYIKNKNKGRFLLLVTMHYDVVITSKILQKEVWYLYEDKSGGRLLAFSILGTKSSSFCCVILSQISH